MKFDRTIRPESQLAKKFELPSIESFTLGNGLQVFCTKKAKLPIIKMNLIIPAGSRFDAYGHEGLAYLTSLVIDEGAGKYSALQLANEIDKLGSSIDISTSVDYIFISLTSLTEHFERTLELFSLILKEPLLNSESFEREKKKHITKILQSFDDASYIGANAFQRNIFKGTPYDKPLLGFSSSVEAFNLTLVKDFHSTFFHSPETKLVVAGDIDNDNLSALLDKHLGDYKLNKSAKDREITNKYKPAKLFGINKECAA